MNDHQSLERNIEHSISYAWRFAKRTFTNFYWTATKQSLFTSLLLAAVLAAASIYTGVAKFGDAANNVFATEIIILATLVIFLAVSIARVPFQLDRERIESHHTAGQNHAALARDCGQKSRA